MSLAWLTSLRSSHLFVIWLQPNEASRHKIWRWRCWHAGTRMPWIRHCAGTWSLLAAVLWVVIRLRAKWTYRRARLPKVPKNRFQKIIEAYSWEQLVSILRYSLHSETQLLKHKTQTLGLLWYFHFFPSSFSVGNSIFSNVNTLKYSLLGFVLVFCQEIMVIFVNPIKY